MIEKAGKRARTVKPGDSVVLESGTFGRSCNDCRNGRVDLCNNGPNYWLKGPMGFSEYIIAPQEMAIPYTGITHEEASLVEPLGVAIDLVKAADITLGNDVLVIGLGPIGLMALALARRQGASHIIAASRRDRPGRIGACPEIRR